MDQILKTQWKLQAPACGWYISYLYRKSGTQISAALKDMNLSGNQSVVLVGIYRNEGSNQRARSHVSGSAGLGGRRLCGEAQG